MGTQFPSTAAVEAKLPTDIYHNDSYHAALHALLFKRRKPDGKFIPKLVYYSESWNSVYMLYFVSHEEKAPYFRAFIVVANPPKMVDDGKGGYMEESPWVSEAWQMPVNNVTMVNVMKFFEHVNYHSNHGKIPPDGVAAL